MATFTKTEATKLRSDLVAGDIINEDGVMVVVKTVETMTSHECRQLLLGRRLPQVGNWKLPVTVINGDYDAFAADFPHTLYVEA